LIPFGSTVDASTGILRLTTATAGGSTQSARFYAGRFELTQAASRATKLKLNAPLRCPRAAALARASGRASRSLWGSGHGRFTTGGRYASATVLGTKWLTTDTCAYTRITVASGEVRVRDLVRHRTVVVHQPHSYTAKR